MRMWKVAEPEMSSTSCSAARSSSVSSSAGQRADDVDQQPRRQDDGALAHDLALERHAQADLHVGRPQLDRTVLGLQLDAGERLDGAARRRGTGDGLELGEQRVAASRELHVVGGLKSSMEMIKRGDSWSSGLSMLCIARAAGAAPRLGAHRRLCMNRRSLSGAPDLTGCPRGPRSVVARRRRRRGRWRCARRCAGTRGGRSCGCGRRTPGRSPAASRSVSSRARYMATWRGQATGAARLVESSCSIETPNASHVRCWISLHGPACALGARVEAGEDLLGELGGDGPAGERAEGDDADQRALERAHVGVHALGDAARAPRRRRRRRRPAGRACEDRQPRGEVGRADVGDQARLEALAQAVLERVEVARKPVGGQDELRAGAVQRVEGVEELLLGAALLCEELDVVDEQHVDVAIGGLERLDRAGVQRAEEAGR